MRLTESILYALGIAKTCTAKRLYVSSYAGTITTIDINTTPSGYDLKVVANSTGCAPSPSWLEIDSKTHTLYCADENNLDPHFAFFSAFKPNEDGSLVKLSNVTTLNGGVHTTIYGDGKALAISHYGGTGLSTINIQDPSKLRVIESLVFTRSAPQTDPASRQKAPFLHQVILDPTKKFILVPDLGTDQVHMMKIQPDYRLKLADSVFIAPASGPRHGVFYTPSDTKDISKRHELNSTVSSTTWFYLVTELTSHLHGYKIDFENMDTLGFELVYMHGSIFGDREKPNNTTYASEIIITPDNRFLIISSRGDNSFQLPNPDKTNSTKVPSDTLLTYSIDSASGQLTKLQEFPAGGLFPRSFSLNKKGDLVAVALQMSSRVALIKRNVESGKMLEMVGSVGVEGQVTSVIWDEGGNEEEDEEECDSGDEDGGASQGQ